MQQAWMLTTKHVFKKRIYNILFFSCKTFVLYRIIKTASIQLKRKNSTTVFIKTIVVIEHLTSIFKKMDFKSKTVNVRFKKIDFKSKTFNVRF